ncbi:MAG: hypothetical protein PHR35_16450, partial [Kiritimatiellae bacterium]|nr:hypothetical protein [Kiritimatiellia bacterium]
LEGNGTIMIGGPQELFRGAIDNVRLYRRALSEAEAQAHFEERRAFRQGSQPGAGDPPPNDPSLVLWLDFNTLTNGVFLDRSSWGLAVANRGGGLGEGADGLALHLTNAGAHASVDLPPALREFNALTVEAWISPDDPQNSTILGSPHPQNTYNAMPFAFRWRGNQSFWLFMNAPDGELRNFMGGAASPSILYPKRYTWSLSNSLTRAAVTAGTFASDPKTGESECRLELPPLTAGVYRLQVEALGEDGETLDRCATELAVAGEVAQPSLKPDVPLPLKKVDEADLTADKPGHDFYSYSGRSKVVKGEHGNWRETLGYKECHSYLSGLGAAGWWAYDWYGVRFKTEQGKIYVVEMEYPDRAFMSISAAFVEPKDDPTDGKCRPTLRTAPGLYTGTYVPHDNTLKTFQSVHFASAPWVAVCVQNAHGAPTEGKELTPASVKRITLYEVVGDLPKLDAPADGGRLLGVHCESGDLSMYPFGVEKLRGEGGWLRSRPPTDESYRHAYPAIANLIRYMRYRGDTALYFGIYRYMLAQFPSRTFPGSGRVVEQDLPMLMARMFEKNDLKLVLTVQPFKTLPTARLQECSHDDVNRGALGATPVNSEGRQGLMHRCSPSAHPFHPRVRETFARLAAELGERYGRCPAVAGMAWITGQSYWEPCLPTLTSGTLPAEEVERALLGAVCDDETMRQFEQWAGIALPGKAGEPDRFKRRFEWIMANARDVFKDFRCWAMAQTHLAFKEAFAKKAPGKDYLAIDVFAEVFPHKAEWEPVEACRLFGSGPQYYRDIPGLIHCPYVPEANGCVHWEHGQMSRDSVPKLEKFVRDDALAREWDTHGKSARYLHRQFYEQGWRMRPGTWFWAPEVDWLGGITYPMPGGRAYLLDFLLLLARGTPDYISYMWCDGSLPMGHEPQHREFAAAYRALPPGYYQEADRRDEVFVRYQDGKRKVFYAVNTRGEPVRMELKTGVSGKFVDAVSGAALRVRSGKAVFDLQPYQFKVYVRQ